MIKAKKIAFLIKLINDEIARNLNNSLRQDGITRSQMEIIEYLMQNLNKKVIQKDIIEYLGIDHSTVTGLIKRMEKKGLIECIQDSKDKRTKIIQLKFPDGLPLPPLDMSFSLDDFKFAEDIPELQPFLEKYKYIDDMLLKGLSIDDQDNLIRMLKIIRDNFNK